MSNRQEKAVKKWSAPRIKKGFSKIVLRFLENFDLIPQGLLLNSRESGG